MDLFIDVSRVIYGASLDEHAALSCAEYMDELYFAEGIDVIEKTRWYSS